MHNAITERITSKTPRQLPTRPVLEYVQRQRKRFPGSTTWSEVFSFCVSRTISMAVTPRFARWVGWICGWGGAALAALGGASTKLYPHDDTLPVWCGLTAAALVAINQAIKPDNRADAHYRGHILQEEAFWDCELGKGSNEGLVDAWHRAQSGAPRTGWPTSDSSSSPSDWKLMRPVRTSGANSIRRSTSLSGGIWLRADDPKSASSLTSQRRHSSANAKAWTKVVSDGMLVANSVRIGELRGKWTFVGRWGCLGVLSRSGG